MADLTLWVDAFWISPYAFSSFVALEEKKLPYDVEEVKMHEGGNRAPDYARCSLTARVPMLRHGDFHLSESSAIAEYLRHREEWGGVQMLPLGFEVVIGGLTTTGSLMAAGKLQEIIPTRPITYKNQNLINFSLFALAIIIGVTLVLPLLAFGVWRKVRQLKQESH